VNRIPFVGSVRDSFKATPSVYK